MGGIDKPHTGKYKEITNDWDYDASWTLTSLPVWDFENFKRLIFVVQSVQCKKLVPAIQWCRWWGGGGVVKNADCKM
jgi:hypothetical protein